MSKQKKVIPPEDIVRNAIYDEVKENLPFNIYLHLFDADIPTDTTLQNMEMWIDLKMVEAADQFHLEYQELLKKYNSDLTLLQKLNAAKPYPDFRWTDSRPLYQITDKERLKQRLRLFSDVSEHLYYIGNAYVWVSNGVRKIAATDGYRIIVMDLAEELPFGYWTIRPEMLRTGHPFPDIDEKIPPVQQAWQATFDALQLTLLCETAISYWKLRTDYTPTLDFSEVNYRGEIRPYATLAGRPFYNLDTKEEEPPSTVRVYGAWNHPDLHYPCVPQLRNLNPTLTLLKKQAVLQKALDEEEVLPWILRVNPIFLKEALAGITGPVRLQFTVNDKLNQGMPGSDVLVVERMDGEYHLIMPMSVAL